MTLPAVPGFVVMELIQDARNGRELRQALRLVAPLPVVWPTEVDLRGQCPILLPTTYRTVWACWMR